ncbi:MAG: EAL domain-containing protein [Methylotenera sp.]|uniref:EAL domain-containing protein n=1 Tax=Methylotenera sp. TaxID=2051956 RepID=UPI00248A257A|nr:EAL domain-containing protein [Methylotenera sp.]MDI1310367.1 EAL domain-containing protein [Methylotenera sp.]
MKKLDILAQLQSDPDSASNLSTIMSKELALAGHLLDSLQGVAILAVDEKWNVIYANPYARDIFNLNVLQVEAKTAQLPKAVHKRTLIELKKSSSNFVMQYAAGDELRTLQVFTSPNKDIEGLFSGLVLHMHDVTERIHTELQLKNTEKLLRNLIDASPDLIFFKDDKNRWVEANTTSVETFQLDQLDYQQKTDRELAAQSHPIFEEAFRNSKISDDQAWELGRSIRNEEVIALPHGDAKVYDLIKVPLFNDDGSRHGLVTLGRDITDRKMAESNLRDRSAILDALISCDWLLHSAESWQTVAVTVLQQLCLALRFTRATILKNIEPSNKETTKPAKSEHSKILFTWTVPGFSNADNGLEVINFDDARLSRWKDTLQHGDPVFGDIRDLPSSERKILEQHDTQSIAIVPLFSDKVWWGNIIIERCHDLIKTTPQELGSLMAIGRSLSVAIQRESAGKRLHQAKIAFDSASEGIMITDDKIRIAAINKGFTEITGYSEEEVLGHTPKIIQSGNHDERFYKDMWGVIKKEGRWHGEVSNKRKNGENYYERLTITAVKDSAGQVVNYVGVFADITDIKHSQNRLHELVNHDPLTGLPNRRLLNELLEHSIKRAEREKHKIALLFIDLDRFKAVNDSLGHQIGDKLLLQASKRISLSIRESDVVARLGGDEFVVMMDMITKSSDAAVVAKKIIHALQIEFDIDDNDIYISASVGISIFPKDSTDVEGLIKAADIAMYQVKNKGKNSHCFYSEDLSKNAVERFTLEGQLHHALLRKQFVVHYQPQICLITGKIIGAEALIRWNHPKLGLVSPATFIPMAEDNGLIVQIGEWVLREAALQMVSWHKAGLAIQWVAVNVSGVQIMRSNFADTVYGILMETDCNPHMLELEITESTVMQNTEHVIDTFNRVKQLGLKLAIDDFGTGFSSLSSLKRLPLDKIKIDQSFVRGLPDDLDDAAIANAIYAMAGSLGFSVIAEGVETQAQADFLSAMGCKEAQGYLYSKPITAKEFTKLLTK